MFKYGYLKNKHLHFIDDGTFHFSDERKMKKLCEQKEFLERYIATTKLKYLIYATLEDGKFASSIITLEKPIVFTTLYAFKMYIIKGSPTMFFYIERR